MILKNIPLPAFVIANLFKNSLVDTNTIDINTKEVQTVPATTDTTLNSSKHILVLINSAEAELLPDDQLTFLTEVLNACKLSLNDVDILNLHNREAKDHKNIPDLFKARIIILFGVELSALELPFKIPTFQVQLYKDKKYIYLPPLYAIQNDKVLKRQLWELLKGLFLA